MERARAEAKERVREKTNDVQRAEVEAASALSLILEAASTAAL